MRILLLPLLFLPLFTFGEQLVIPALQSAISQQLSKFSAYTAFTGTATVGLPLETPHVKVNAIAQPNVAVAPAAVVPSSSAFPYWYETITHQGKAAFNTNTTYVVYRNVKSYGAKG